MHVVQEDTSFHPSDQVEKISRCHFTERGGPRDKCLPRRDWGGLDLPEWGDAEEDWGRSRRGNICVLRKGALDDSLLHRTGLFPLGTT